MIKNDTSWLKKLEGKSIASVKPFGHESMLNYFIRIDFTDGTSNTFLYCRPNQVSVDTEVKKLFITLWTKAGGGKDYIKKEWTRLSNMLRDRGINI